VVEFVGERRAALLRRPSDLSARVELRCFTGNRGGPDDVGGVSTRRVDELVQAMGMTGISKSSVSKLCKDIEERVNSFLTRPLEGEWLERAGVLT
jgi:hypothetical protein